jgi:hypothetical protein
MGPAVTVTATATPANGHDAVSNPVTFQVTAANLPPVVTPASAQTAVEGTFATFDLGSFIDPGPLDGDHYGQWTVDVNWGDGGAAVYEAGGIVTVASSTFTANSATGGQGGAGGTDSLGDSGPTGSAGNGEAAFFNAGGVAQLVNTIVAANTSSTDSPDVFGMFASEGHNLIGDGSGSDGFVNGSDGDQVGTSASPIQPYLSSLGNHGGPTPTVALLPGSPAINGSDTSVAPATDQRGIARVGAADIGAFESKGFVLAAVGNTTLTTPTTLAVTVVSNAGEPVDGGVVTFTAPGTGPSADFPDGSTATISGGQASVSAAHQQESTSGRGTVAAPRPALAVAQPPRSDRGPWTAVP